MLIAHQQAGGAAAADAGTTTPAKQLLPPQLALPAEAPLYSPVAHPPTDVSWAEHERAYIFLACHSNAIPRPYPTQWARPSDVYSQHALLLPLAAAHLQDGLREAREILQQLNVLATDDPGTAGATPEVAAAGAADAEEEREEEEEEEASGSEVGGGRRLWQHWQHWCIVVPAWPHAESWCSNMLMCPPKAAFANTLLTMLQEESSWDEDEDEEDEEDEEEEEEQSEDEERHALWDPSTATPARGGARPRKQAVAGGGGEAQQRQRRRRSSTLSGGSGSGGSGALLPEEQPVLAHLNEQLKLQGKAPVGKPTVGGHSIHRSRPSGCCSVQLRGCS